MDQAFLAVGLAEKALADTTIRAPFDGFITARPVAAGEYVALANKIARIIWALLVNGDVYRAPAAAV